MWAGVSCHPLHLPQHSHLLSQLLPHHLTTPILHNKQDFYNLVDVYLDAVLHPKCVNDKRTFEQVRWWLVVGCWLVVVL